MAPCGLHIYQKVPLKSSSGIIYFWNSCRVCSPIRVISPMKEVPVWQLVKPVNRLSAEIKTSEHVHVYMWIARKYMLLFNIYFKFTLQATQIWKMSNSYIRVAIKVHFKLTLNDNMHVLMIYMCICSGDSRCVDAKLISCTSCQMCICITGKITELGLHSRHVFWKNYFLEVHLRGILFKYI